MRVARAVVLLSIAVAEPTQCFAALRGPPSPALRSPSSSRTHLLRVRGGFFFSQRTSSIILSTSVPTPALLDDALSDDGQDAEQQTSLDAIAVFRRVLSFVWVPNLKAQALVVASLLALVVSKSLNVLVPFALKRAVDTLEASSSSAELAQRVPSLLVAYVATRLGVAIANEGRTVAFTRVSQRSQRAFSQDLFRRLHALDATFHLKSPTGLLAVAFGRGVNGFRSLLFQLLFSILPTLLELGLSCTILARRFSPSLAGVTLLTFGLYAAWTAAVVEMRIRLRKRLAKLDNAKAAYLVDSLGGTESLKMVGGEAAELGRFDTFLREIASTQVRSTEFMALLNAGQATIFGAGLLGAMLLAARGFFAGALSLGDVVAVNGLLLQLARPMDFIGYTFSEIRQSLVDMDAMLKVVAASEAAASEPPPAPLSHDGLAVAAPASAGTGGGDLEEGRGGAPSRAAAAAAPSVEFDRVTFTYPNASAPALVDASFYAPAGGVTALVGLSGSGKSTALRLISKLSVADAGSVRVGGRDVAGIAAAEVREGLSLVAQQPWLADDTIRWNILLGRPGADEADVEAAAEAAALTPSLALMPRGLATRVGQGGARLSGGERQRVVIARALLRGAPLLLADEPTAAADALTEGALVEALSRGTGAVAAAASSPTRRRRRSSRSRRSRAPSSS